MIGNGARTSNCLNHHLHKYANCTKIYYFESLSFVRRAAWRSGLRRRFEKERVKLWQWISKWVLAYTHNWYNNFILNIAFLHSRNLEKFKKYFFIKISTENLLIFSVKSAGFFCVQNPTVIQSWFLLRQSQKITDKFSTSLA